MYVSFDITMHWMILLFGAALCGLACGECNTRSTFLESTQVLSYLNWRRVNENQTGLVWDENLAEFAESLITSCAWVYDKWPQVDCIGREVGVVYRYMSESQKNVDYLLNSLWDESKKVFGNERDTDNMGRSYAMLSRGRARAIGCALGDCFYGFCVVDVFTAYRI